MWLKEPLEETSISIVKIMLWPRTQLLYVWPMCAHEYVGAEADTGCPSQFLSA